MFVVEPFLQLIDLEENVAAYPIISDIPEVQQHYECCRAEGTSHSLAEMFALQVPPQSNSDREFLLAMRQGRESQFRDGSPRAEHIRRRAEEAGINTRSGVYVPELCRHISVDGGGPGDPMAWVSDLGEARKRVEELGMSCQGRLNVKGREMETPPEKSEPALDITYDRCLDRLQDNPDLWSKAEAKPREFFEETQDMLRPKWQNVYGQEAEVASDKE